MTLITPITTQIIYLYNKGIELCKQYKQHWRAATLQGGQMLHDAEVVWVVGVEGVVGTVKG